MSRSAARHGDTSNPEPAANRQRSSTSIEVGRTALEVTHELRLLSVAEGEKGSAHESVEHQRLADLERVLLAGSNVDDVTTDGMTWLHHVLDAAAQSGEPLSAEM